MASVRLPDPTSPKECTLSLFSRLFGGRQAAIERGLHDLYTQMLCMVAGHTPTQAERAATEAKLQEEYREDVDIQRLASELVVDAIVAPAKLRDEIAARLRAAEGRRDPQPRKRRSVTPM